MKWIAVLVALVVGASFPTASGGRPPAAGHLEAHGKVLWVLQRSDTGEVVSVRPGRISISAMDTDPSAPPCLTPDCEPSDDRISASIDDNPKVTEGSFDAGPELPAGHSRLFLPNGLFLLVVDGGEPGAEPLGPPDSSGISPTRDYVKWLNLSPSFTLHAYLQSGNIQLHGTSAG